MGQLEVLFIQFRPFQATFYRKTVIFSGIRTWIVRVVGKYADHLITTTAPVRKMILTSFCKVIVKLCLQTYNEIGFHTCLNIFLNRSCWVCSLNHRSVFFASLLVRIIESLEKSFHMLSLGLGFKTRATIYSNSLG